VFDLAADPAPLIREPVEHLQDLVFTPTEDLPEEVERLPLKIVHTNHVPMLAPLATLKGVDTQRIQLDPERCIENARSLLGELDTVRVKAAEVFGHAFGESQSSPDPDRMLYSGDFFSAGDRHLMNKILAVPPDKLGGHLWSFQDDRLPLMLFRYRARNYPETLSLEEARVWDRDRRARLRGPADSEYFRLDDFRRTMEEQREQKKDDPEAMRILDQLDAWVLETGIEDL
jgi:exodeoxyribonuclease-1